MSQTLLDQLNTMTVTVADTGDIHSIEKIRPRDATTNPSLITTAAQMPEYGEIVDEAHLHGVLARLQALGLQVVSLRSVPD